MCYNHPRPDRFFVDVQFQIDAKKYLGRDGNKQDGGERTVHGWQEHATFVRMAQYISPYRQEKASALVDNGVRQIQFIEL